MKTNRPTAIATITKPKFFSRVARRLWFALLLLGALATPPAAPAQPAQPLARTDRILVRPIAGADLGTLHALLGTSVLRTFPAIGGLQIVQLPAGAFAPTLITLFQQSGLAEYAEPDLIVHILAEPNDFRFWDGSLWAMKNTGQLGGTPGADINAPQGWDIQNSAATVVVAVVDTGIRLTHEDLAGNLWTNPGEIAANGADDDNDGFIDDVHGINAITGTGDPTDDHGHGSHVSGTIGATGNNSVGVVGVLFELWGDDRRSRRAGRGHFFLLGRQQHRLSFRQRHVDGGGARLGSRRAGVGACSGRHLRRRETEHPQRHGFAAGPAGQVCHRRTAQSFPGACGRAAAARASAPAEQPHRHRNFVERD